MGVLAVGVRGMADEWPPEDLDFLRRSVLRRDLNCKGGNTIAKLSLQNIDLP